MAQQKWPAVLAGPATRPCPFEALACGYRHRGGYPPALSQTEVACWASSAWWWASRIRATASALCWLFAHTRALLPQG